MSKISYTWYPKDWAYSDKTFNLNLAERGLYRELIDLAMINDNKVPYDLKSWGRRFNTDWREVEKLVTTLRDEALVTINGGILKVPSCEPRLQLKRGGAKGGRISRKPQKKVVQKVVQKTIEERKEKFRKDLGAIKEGYEYQTLKDFFDYWTERGPDDKKMRFEKEKSWDIKRRMATWAKREIEFKKKQKL